jgi:hypothetical protein
VSEGAGVNRISARPRSTSWPNIVDPRAFAGHFIWTFDQLRAKRW